MGGHVQEVGTGAGTFRDSPRKCRESRVASSLLTRSQLPDRSAQPPINPRCQVFSEELVWTVCAQKGRGEGGARRQAGNNAQRRSRTAKEPEPRRTQPGISPDAKAQDPAVPSQLPEPRTLAAGHTSGLEDRWHVVGHTPRDAAHDSVYTVCPAIDA